MIPVPSGQVLGKDLILRRAFHAPIADIWASVTESARTALWIGPWEGEAGQGKTVRLRLIREEGQPWTQVLIEGCEAPRHLRLRTKDVSGEWRLELFLIQAGETTELRFVHHMDDAALAADIGPGWEYYLDMLVASREGKALPVFSAYYPAQKAYYIEKAEGASAAIPASLNPK